MAGWRCRLAVLRVPGLWVGRWCSSWQRDSRGVGGVFNRPVQRRLSEGSDDFCFEVLLEALDAVLATDTGLLVAAVGRGGAVEHCAVGVVPLALSAVTSADSLLVPAGGGRRCRRRAARGPTLACAAGAAFSRLRTTRSPRRWRPVTRSSSSRRRTRRTPPPGDSAIWPSPCAERAIRYTDQPVCPNWRAVARANPAPAPTISSFLAIMPSQQRANAALASKNRTISGLP